MPPKAKPAAAPSKKADQKKKEKVIEDKTFGLKNKKGSKQQKFIQQVEKQVKTGGIPPRKVVDDSQKRKEEKAKKELEKKELSLLFKPVITQKVDKGTDPKSVLCAFFKQGQCVKGDKCKFSHDLTIERKAEKRSLYVDMRDDEEDNMDAWDEEKLNDVIGLKHGETNATNATEIICKYFLDAVEKSKYGWFWECPTGAKCHYRHALPPGFILKKDKKREEKKDEITIEELVERERAALSTRNLTKVTLESMTAWKKRKLKEKRDALAKDEEKKRTDYRAGRQNGLSGREMFYFNPDLARDDGMEDGDEAIVSYQREDEEEEMQYRELELETLENEASEVDGTGTVAALDRLAQVAATQPKIEEEDESAGAAAVPINENLFLDEDLDSLEEELDDLSIDH